MTKLTRNLTYALMACLTAAMAFGLTTQSARASHSFLISPVQTCQDGAIFDGQPTAESSLGLEMWGQVFDEFGTFIIEGNSHVFSQVGEVFRYVVAYPAGTFFEGDTIYVSGSDSLGSEFGAEGDSEFTVVSDCVLGDEIDLSSIVLPYRLQPPVCNDDRVNCQQFATALAYCREDGLDIYFVNPSTPNVLALVPPEENLVFTATTAEIDAVGFPFEDTVIKTGRSPVGDVTLWRLYTGDMQVAEYNEQTGKLYTYTWFDYCF